MLKTAKDDLQCTTEYVPHEHDDKINNKEDGVTIDVTAIGDMFSQLDSMGVRQVDNSKRSLSIIGKRHGIINQDIPDCTITIPDITSIPERITPFINATIGKRKTQQLLQCNDKQHINNSNNTMSCPMIIDILNDVVLEGFAPNKSITNDMHTNSLENLNDLSFAAIIQKYTLDFKQAVAFEIMASSFILKSLDTENISNDVLRDLFQANNDHLHKYTCSLSGLKKNMTKKGAKNNLIMFLSGMGGTGKSEVIKAFVTFAKGISYVFGWKYDNNTVKITALTGTAACEIPNGRTLHSQACLSNNRITKHAKDSWKST